MIRINGKQAGESTFIAIDIAVRAKTVKLTAYQWAGHQSSAAEGKIAEVRVVRATVAECVSELKARWMGVAGQTKYVGFGGQFRHAPYYTAPEVLEAIDALEERLDDAGLLATA